MHRVPALHLQKLGIVPRLLCHPPSPVQEHKIWENRNKGGQNSLSEMFGEIAR